MAKKRIVGLLILAGLGWTIYALTWALNIKASDESQEDGSWQDASNRLLTHLTTLTGGGTTQSGGSNVTQQPIDRHDPQIRITHFNRHNGVENNIHYILTHLNLTFVNVNPEPLTPFGQPNDKAESLRNLIKYICSTSDVIITGDTMPDARAILLELDNGGCSETHVVFEITTRFDLAVPDDRSYWRYLVDAWGRKVEPDETERKKFNDSYSGLVRRLIQKKLGNVHWVANNPFEPEYLYAKVGIRAPFHVIRPMGYSSVRDGEVSQHAGLPFTICSGG
jgi:hypothetical protein